MAKESFYFSHDYNARNDEKILELRSTYGAEGYGLFWMIVETMAENTNGGIKASLIGGLSLGYGVAKETLLATIHFCLEIGLFYEEKGFYYSKRLLSHKQMRAFLSEKGKEGAKNRWKNGVANRDGIGEGNAKERKGKERKEDNNTHIFNQKPTFEDVKELPENKITSAIQLVKITKQTDITNEQVSGLWVVFKHQSLTGKKFYNNLSDVHSHFLNWIKTQKFENGRLPYNVEKPSMAIPKVTQSDLEKYKKHV